MKAVEQVAASILQCKGYWTDADQRAEFTMWRSSGILQGPFPL